MIEVRPQFTYSPDGEFVVTTGLKEEYGIDDTECPDLVGKRLEHVEQLSTADGVEAEQIQKGVIQLTVDIGSRFRRSFNNSGNPDIALFLQNLDRVLPFHPEDMIDRVVSVDSLSDRGAYGVINHHFQRWLNTAAITEEVAKHCLLAMALPFGEDSTKKTARDFSFIGTEMGEVATAWTSRLVTRLEDFGISRTDETEQAHLEYSGKVQWRWVDLSTLGSCACWGPTGEERRRIHIEPNHLRLYEMSPHNIDFARQSLSLVLGIGSLAYFAAQYAGRESILADARWGEPRVYPKTTEF